MAKTKTKKAKNGVGEKEAEEALAQSHKTTSEGITSYLEKIPESPFPETVMPMLATLTDKPFDDDDWFYEVKWDGYRALAFLKDGEVELRSRNNKSFNEKFYPIHSLLRTWKLNAVMDGEILVLNKKGISDFSTLQNWRSEADGELVFYVFDLLYLEGKNLMQLPLRHRLELLKQVLPTDDDRVRISKIFEAKGTEFFAAAGKMGLEGIIAKRADSTYIPDFRSKDWLKIKVNQRQEVVIGGFTRNDGSSKLFSSLLLGVFENGKFQYVGKVGTGFSDKLQKQMMESFNPLITGQCPFVHEPDYNKPSRFRPNPPHATATWLKPELVCEVSFAEVTSDGVFRHPSFEGMREDKKAEEVRREVSTPLAEAVPESNELHKNMVSAPKPKANKTLLIPSSGQYSLLKLVNFRSCPLIGLT